MKKIVTIQEIIEQMPEVWGKVKVKPDISDIIRIMVSEPEYSFTFYNDELSAGLDYPIKLDDDNDANDLFDFCFWTSTAHYYPEYDSDFPAKFEMHSITLNRNTNPAPVLTASPDDWN